MDPTGYIKAGLPMGGPRGMLKMEDDEDDDDDNGAEAVDEDDMILAGGNIPQDESAYNKLIAAAEGDAPLEGKLMTPPPIELKCWLQWYLALEDHDFFVEIEREYIMDKINLVKIREQGGSQLSKNRFKNAIRLILSSKVPSEVDLQNPQFLELNQEAFDLYGRIHARYVQTPAGLARLY